MKIRWMLSALISVLAFVLPAGAQPTLDDLFDRSVLHAVQISMSEADWALLRTNYQASTEYPATITIDGETLSGCTIRSRGSGTRNRIKPGLRVDFNAVEKSQRFRGLKNLVVDNMYNDPSFLREQLAFSVFEEMGILVPREAFARMSVNGQYWGLYAVIEPMDKTFVSSHVDGGDGNLFEYNAPSPPSPDVVAWDFTLSRGPAIEDYVPAPFEPKTNEDDLDGTALLAFIRTVTEEPDETFVSAISQFIDPRVLLTYYAVEVATAEVDGLTSYFGVNNFYLYQYEGTGSFLFIPWDHDFNFTSVGHDIYYGLDRNRLMKRLMADPELNTYYRDTLRVVVDDFMNPEWMTPRIDAMLAQIHDSVLADTKRRGGADNPTTATQTFDDAVAQIRTVVDGRPINVNAQLDHLRRRTVRH